MEWIDCKDSPDINFKDPVLTKRDSPFKYGLVYRIEVEKSKFEWRFNPEVISWAYIEPPKEK